MVEPEDEQLEGQEEGQLHGYRVEESMPQTVEADGEKVEPPEPLGFRRSEPSFEAAPDVDFGPAPSDCRP